MQSKSLTATWHVVNAELNRIDFAGHSLYDRGDSEGYSLEPSHLANDELIAFGRHVHSLREPAIAAGGFLVVPTRPESLAEPAGGKETGDPDVRHAERAQEARSPTGARTGRRASAATATGAASHPVEPRLAELLALEELFEYHDDATWLDGSSASVLLSIPVGLFRTLPYRATLVLEIPRAFPAWLPLPARWPTNRPESYAPFVRAWAISSDGILITAHHQYPDLSVCACKEEDWVLGRNSIEDYVAYCICWIAKVLHMQLVGWWPGRQHYPAAVRVSRNMPAEFCGCGKTRPYSSCCMAEDLGQTTYTRWWERHDAEAAYIREIHRRKLTATPPFRLR